MHHLPLLLITQTEIFQLYKFVAQGWIERRDSQKSPPSPRLRQDIRKTELRKAQRFFLMCVFTVWLELILSETPERNQTKEASPPPLATTRHPARKVSSLFLLCARRT